MKIELSLALLIKHLGPYERKIGNEYEWQCPYCASNFGDTSKDNLKYNDKKKVLFCFADSSHSANILKEIYQDEKEQNIMFNNIWNSKSYNIYKINSESNNNLTLEQLEKFKLDMLRWNTALLENETMLEYLQQIRGINKNTVDEVLIGFDDTEKRWTIPTIKYNTSTDINDIEVIGFEYRPIDFNKKGIRREKNTPSYLAMINNYVETTQILIVVEGYFDGYALYQYLTECGQIDYYHIVTCSNGVNSLQKQLSAINLSKYKKYTLFIDNDTTSRKVSEKILEEYPYFEDFIAPGGFKDFNDFYIDYIKRK